MTVAPGPEVEPAGDLEAQVEQLYERIQLPKSWLKRLREELEAEITARQHRNTAEREFLTRKLAKADTERRKLLDAYYAAAIDVTTLKTEQARIAADVRDGKIATVGYHPPFDLLFSTSEFEYGDLVGPAGLEPTNLLTGSRPGRILSCMANETVICTYRVRPAAEGAFDSLLARHWDTLRELELVTEQRSTVFRSLDEPPTYVEIFTWVEGGFDRAHEHPDVLSLWEQMDPLLEERDGMLKWEFPHFRPVSPGE